jgi:endonuclease/exonuclease/phosphatase family metal-dependent hydrolase
MMRAFIGVLALVPLAAAAACDTATEPQLDAAFQLGTAAAPRAQPLTVMSRNLYLGADISVLLQATDPSQVPFKVAELWAEVVANDFPHRAGALAAEIAIARPHLVGLQEVSTYYMQSPGDFLAGNPVEASDVLYDYLAILLDSLEARGLDYRVAARGSTMQVEVPMVTMTGLVDIRFVMADAILARGDVATSNPQAAHLPTSLQFLLGGAFPLAIPRGWASVDAAIEDRRIHFVTTHLEAFHPGINQAQGVELLQVVAGRPDPVVMVGDFNVTPDGARGQTYANVLGAGFIDLWAAANGERDGPTCCFDHLLSSTSRSLEERIDFIFVRDTFRRGDVVGAYAVELVGNEFGDRTAGGLWPSDHAGLVGYLRLPRAGGLARQ